MTRVTQIVLVPRLVGLTERAMRTALVARTVDPDPPGSKPKKKSQKKKKSKETPSGGDTASGEKAATLEGSTDDSSLKKKKTKKAKRSREDLGDREDLDNDSSKGASGENPKKMKKSKKERHAEKAQQSPGLEEAPVVQGSPRVGEEVVECDSQEKAPSEGALVRTESPGGPSVPPVKDRGTVPQRTPAEATLPEEESCPRTGEENAEEGRSLVREDPLSGVDPEKVVEIDDSSQGDEEEDAEETQSPIPAETGEPVEQEGPRGRNEDGMVPVDAPESQTVPEDVEAAEELDAELHIAAEETHV
ncbi:hypothetical protein Bca101_024322 [Brassica carinata]